MKLTRHRQSISQQSLTAPVPPSYYFAFSCCRSSSDADSSHAHAWLALSLQSLLFSILVKSSLTLAMFATTASTALATGESGASGSPEHQLPPRLRQKRSQVSRACDGCRIHRTKCDNNRPCSNCKNRGKHCSNSDATKVSTLSQAYEEIEHLRQKVQELEVKLKQEHQRNVNLDHNLLTPPSLSPSQVSQFWKH